LRNGASSWLLLYELYHGARSSELRKRMIATALRLKADAVWRLQNIVKWN